MLLLDAEIVSHNLAFCGTDQCSCEKKTCARFIHPDIMHLVVQC